MRSVARSSSMERAPRSRRRSTRFSPRLRESEVAVRTGLGRSGRLLMILAACGAANSAPQKDHKILLRGASLSKLADGVKAATEAWRRLGGTADGWIGGENLWGFHAWTAALVGVLTGDAKYCTAAVAAVDKQVTAAESAIAAGKLPEVAGDSYLQV